MGSVIQGLGRHRANYILERGTWRATCRLCGWQASDASRRQAATLFRFHIRDAGELEITMSDDPGGDDYAMAPSA